MNLYENITELCKQKSISLYRLQKEAGLRRGYFSDLKRRKSQDIMISKAKLIADVLNVSLDDLVK